MQYEVVVNSEVRFASVDRSAIANYIYTLLMSGVTDLRVREED